MRARAIILIFTLGLIAASCAEEAPLGETEPTATPAPVVIEADQTADTRSTSEHDDEASSHEEMDETHHSEDDGMHSAGAHDEDHEETTAAGVDRVVTVTMTEFAFSPDHLEVAAGETIRFEITNEGAIEHEFRMTSEHAAAEHLASGHMDHGTAGGHGHEDMMVTVEAGGVATLDVEFIEAGDFDLYACLIPGHFEAGMFGELTFAPA